MKKKYWPIVAIGLLAVLWWALGRRDAAPTIHFTKTRIASLESTVSTNGKVEPAEWAAARAEIAGVVRGVSVQRGQQVGKGQELVMMDAASASSALTSALAAEGEARAQSSTLTAGGKAATLANLNDSIASAQSAVEVAQRNYESTSRLAQQLAATKLQVQTASDAVVSAKQRLEAFENQKRTLVTASDRSVAASKVEDAEAAVSLARHRLALSHVTSPIAGTLYQFDLKVGAYLQPGEQVGLVGDLDRVKVTVYVDEPDLGRVAVHMPVTITWDARPGQKWTGHVEKLPTEVTALGTRTVGEVITVVDNPDHNLLPGVTVNALVTSRVSPHALTIPKSALHTLHGVSGVYKLVGNKMAWTAIQTGISDVNQVEVVHGLQDGDAVADRAVEPNDAEMKDDMRVKPVFD